MAGLWWFLLLISASVFCSSHQNCIIILHMWCYWAFVHQKAFLFSCCFAQPPALDYVPGPATVSRASRHVLTRVVKWSSDLRTSNFKFEFVCIFQPFDIRIQASLIRCRWFCFESGALLLQRCTVWPFLCSLPAVNSSDARCVFAYPFPHLPSLHTATVFNYSLSCTAPLASYQIDKFWWSRLRADINGQQ